MAQLNFDANQVNPEQSFEPIPAGWYNFMITESEMKPTRDGNGAYLQVTLKVVDGQHAGRLVFDRLNLQNQNPVATEIAYKRLSAYCHATGVIQVQDSQQLHGIPFKARVTVRTDSTGQYEPSNEIKAVKHINEDTGGTTAAPAQQGFQAPPQGFQQQAAPQPQQFQQPAAQQAPAQFQQPQQQPAPQEQQAPAQQGGAPTPPWTQQQAPAAQPTPQAAPAAGPTPPWGQPAQQ